MIVLGPVPCQGCRERVYWNRWWLVDAEGFRHVCQEPNARSMYNGRVGSSDESNRIANGTRASATTGGAGVVSSVEVVAR